MGDNLEYFLYACKTGDERMFKKYAREEFISARGDIAIRIACATDNLDAVKRLIEIANVNIPQTLLSKYRDHEDLELNNSPLALAIKNNASNELVNLLITYSARFLSWYEFRNNIVNFSKYDEHVVTQLVKMIEQFPKDRNICLVVYTPKKLFTQFCPYFDESDFAKLRGFDFGYMGAGIVDVPEDTLQYLFENDMVTLGISTIKALLGSGTIQMVKMAIAKFELKPEHVAKLVAEIMLKPPEIRDELLECVNERYTIDTAIDNCYLFRQMCLAGNLHGMKMFYNPVIDFETLKFEQVIDLRKVNVPFVETLLELKLYKKMIVKLMAECVGWCDGTDVGLELNRSMEMMMDYVGPSECEKLYIPELIDNFTKHNIPIPKNVKLTRQIMKDVYAYLLMKGRTNKIPVKLFSSEDQYMDIIDGFHFRVEGGYLAVLKCR